MTIGVVIADDQALVRAGIRMILQAEDDVVVLGEASDGHGAVDVVRRLQPDVVLMDVRMPHLDGIAATRAIVGSHAATRVLVLTTFDLDEHVVAAICAGASGFLLKDTPPEELVAAVRVVAGGDAQLSPSVTRQLLAHVATSPVTAPPDADALASLTDREREVLVLVARGMSNAEIATALFLGETTVKTHVGRVLAKLGVRDRVQATVWAYEQRVVHVGGGATDP